MVIPGTRLCFASVSTNRLLLNGVNIAERLNSVFTTLDWLERRLEFAVIYNIVTGVLSDTLLSTRLMLKAKLLRPKSTLIKR